MSGGLRGARARGNMGGFEIDWYLSVQLILAAEFVFKKKF